MIQQKIKTYLDQLFPSEQGVAKIYAIGIEFENDTNFMEVNTLILGTFPMKSLNRIKSMAWELYRERHKDEIDELDKKAKEEAIKLLKELKEGKE